MQHDSGYPANWMPDVIRMLPKQTIAVVPAGAGVGVMKEEYGRSLQILLAVCGARAADRVRERRQPAARARRRAPRADGRAARDRRVARGRSSRRRWSKACCSRSAAASPVCSSRSARRGCCCRWPSRTSQFLPISTQPSPLVLAFAFGLALLTGIIFGAAPAWFATRTDPVEALRGSGRSTSDHSSFARKALLVVQATLSVVLVAGATMLARSLNKLEHQDFGYQVAGSRRRLAEPAAGDLHAAEAGGALPQHRGAAERAARRAGIRPGALQPAHRQLGRADPRRRPSRAEAGRAGGRVVGPRERQLPAELRRRRWCAAAHFTAADNETTAPVAVVNEAFVKRFFKSDEDPLDQHFGLDLPENASTFRIVGVVRDAKFAGFGLNRPARPMFYVPLAQNVDYHNELMKRIELQSHFIGGMMLVTEHAAGHARAAADASARGGRSEPDDHQRADDAAAGRAVVRPGARASRASPGCSASSRCCWPRSASTASRPTPSRSGPTRSASAWRSAPTAAT